MVVGTVVFLLCDRNGIKAEIHSWECLLGGHPLSPVCFLPRAQQPARGAQTKMLLKCLSALLPCGRAGEGGRISSPHLHRPGEGQHYQRGQDVGSGGPIIVKSPSANQKSISLSLFLKK